MINDIVLAQNASNNPTQHNFKDGMVNSVAGMSLNDFMNALNAQAAAMAAATGGASLHNFAPSNFNQSDANALASAMMLGTAAAANNNISYANNNGAVSPQAASAEYLAQLLRDKKHFTSLPNLFLHAERLIDDEISKVRAALFQTDSIKKEALVLPEAQGEPTTLQEKVYVPIKEHPEFNFVGRILGPRGMTAKQLEQETGCKIMVRGKGSMRDKAKEDGNRGKPNWEHLNDDLHVLIQCEDTENRAAVKMKRAIEEVKKLLTPSAEGEDDLKRKQLLELAIINGTYRPANQAGLPRLLTPVAPQLRSPSLGAPLYLSPTAARNSLAHANASNGFALQAMMPNSAGGFDLSSAATGGYLVPVEQLLSLQAATGFPYTTAAAAFNPQMLGAEYATIESQAGAIQRRLLSQSRDHPYRRSDTSPGQQKGLA